MSRLALQESLSAVMDNEADELELRRVLAASDDSELRSTWSRYQIARAVMHKDLLVPNLDIAAGVSAALAQEECEKAPSVKAVKNSSYRFGRLAVAASVTVAVLAGVRFYNQDNVASIEIAQKSGPALVAPQAQGPVVLAGYTADDALPLQNPLTNETVNRVRSGGQDSFVSPYLRQPGQQVTASEGAALQVNPASSGSR